MPKSAEKLLEKMRQSNKNWKRRDVNSLYTGYGFIIDKKKGKHDKVYHPEYPQLISFIPRHRVIGEWVVDEAVKLVDEYIGLQKQGN